MCAQGFIWAASSLKWGGGGDLLRNAFASLLQIRSAQFARQRRVIFFNVFAQSCRNFVVVVVVDCVFACARPTNEFGLTKTVTHKSSTLCVFASQGLFFPH